MRLLVHLVIASVMIGACQMNAQQDSAKADRNTTPITADDRAIWDVILNEEFPDASKVLVIRQELTCDSADFMYENSNPNPEPALKSFMKKHLPHAPKDAVANMLEREDAHSKFWGPIVPGRKVSILTMSQELAISKRTGSKPIFWQVFKKEYPNTYGIIIVGLPGYDSTKRRAVAYVGHDAENNPHGSRYYALEMTGGKWRIIEKATRWP